MDSPSGGRRRRIIIVRHGSTSWSGRRCCGQLDVELSAAGFDEAKSTAVALAALRPTRIIASDLHRASSTAAEIGAASGAPVRLLRGLREEFLGPWQGLALTEVEARYPAAFARWKTGTLEPHDGREGLRVVAQRAMAALESSGPVDTAGPLVVVTHANVAIGLTASLIGLPEHLWLTLGSLLPGAWSDLTMHQGRRRWTLNAHNQRPGCMQRSHCSPH